MLLAMAFIPLAIRPIDMLMLMVCVFYLFWLPLGKSGIVLSRLLGPDELDRGCAEC